MCTDVYRCPAGFRSSELDPKYMPGSCGIFFPKSIMSGQPWGRHSSSSSSYWSVNSAGPCGSLLRSGLKGGEDGTQLWGDTGFKLYL
jgi:hypothetical protein